jgi:hypothetical protein
MTPFSNNTSGYASQQAAELSNRSRPQACASHCCLRVNASKRSRRERRRRPAAPSAQ